jgi:hypothetical protein
MIETQREAWTVTRVSKSAKEFPEPLHPFSGDSLQLCDLPYVAENPFAFFTLNIFANISHRTSKKSAFSKICIIMTIGFPCHMIWMFDPNDQLRLRNLVAGYIPYSEFGR